MIGFFVFCGLFYFFCWAWNHWILSSLWIKNGKNSSVERFSSQRLSSLSFLPSLPSCQQLLNNFHLLWKYCHYHLLEEFQNLEMLSESNDRLKIIRRFGFIISQLMRLLCYLTFLIIILPLPIYFLKGVDTAAEADEVNYVTHTHQYRWFLTVAYLSGIIPGTLLLVACYISLSFFLYLLHAIDTPRDSRSSNSNSRSSSPSPPSHLPSDLRSSSSSTPLPSLTRRDRLLLVILMIANVAIVGLVNGLYIYSTLIDLSGTFRIVIQLSLSLFNLIWGVILLNLFPQAIEKSRWSVWLLCCFNVSNSVVIPCIVTALTSPSCYQVPLPSPSYSLSSSHDDGPRDYWSMLTPSPQATPMRFVFFFFLLKSRPHVFSLSPR
jgi:hypothetical protein